MSDEKMWVAEYYSDLYKGCALIARRVRRARSAPCRVFPSTEPGG